MKNDSCIVGAAAAAACVEDIELFVPLAVPDVAGTLVELLFTVSDFTITLCEPVNVVVTVLFEDPGIAVLLVVSVAFAVETAEFDVIVPMVGDGVSSPWVLSDFVLV